MKREVERSKSLPSFEIDLAELEVLLTRLIEIFDDPKRVRCSIDIKLKNERLAFESVEEIKSYPSLKGNISSFKIWLSQGNQRVSIGTNSLINSLVTVSAESSTEAWCAGAVETAYSFISSHRTWYHWFVKWPIGVMCLLMLALPAALEKVGYDSLFNNKAVVYSWAFVTLFLTFLYLTKGKLLPVVTLRISQEDNFIRRRAPELSLFIALLTALLTVIGWFTGE